MEELVEGRNQPKQLKHVPLHSQNTRSLLDQLTRTFSQKFENPLIERSPQSIIEEVTANLKVLHSINRSTVRRYHRP